MAKPHAAHFLKPLLPGFESGVPIPLAFYSKHVQRKPNENTWYLKTDASEKMWEVKQEGKRLTVGWENFTTAHNLRVGDIVIFKHEGDMVFHLTPFGPSGCDIQFTHSQEMDDDDEIENRDKIRGTGAMSFDYCFLVAVTASNLEEDKLWLPAAATSCTALSKQSQETILVNKEGRSWTANLRFSESSGIYYITTGWRNLCVHNECELVLQTYSLEYYFF